MRYLTLAILALGLAGCGIPEGRRLSAMTPAELRGVSDRSLCNFYADSRAVDIERQRRQVRCTNSADNPAYTQMMFGGVQMMNQTPPRPQTQVCRQMGNTTHCTTM
jgi:hypothetical protein